MARPLSTSGPLRGETNGGYQPRFTLDDAPEGGAGSAHNEQLETLRLENAQLRSLCADLESALQEATSQGGGGGVDDERIREYDTLLEEKSETIRQLYQQLEEARAAAAEARSAPAPKQHGPLPREDDLLNLSEELERERRQLQEDEQSLMEQMRQMEMSMARERAEMARQRNDLQRLHGEIRHELERLERNGALQSKMDELKARLQDVSNRRGAAPAVAPSKPASSSALPQVPQGGQQPPQQAPNTGASRGGGPSLMGRLFGGGGGGGGGNK